MPKIKKVPEVKPLSKLKMPKPKRGKLDNGLMLYYAESRSAEIVKLDVIFNSGTNKEKNPMEAVFANLLIKEATKGRSSEEVAELFDYYGSSIEYFVTNNKSGLRLNAPIEFFYQILPIFADLILNPSLPEKDFELIKKRYIENLKISEKQTAYQAQININALIFGNENSRGRINSQKDVENLKLEHIKDFISKYYIAKNCFIFIIGSDIENVIKSVNFHFGNSKIENWNKKLYLKRVENRLILKQNEERYKFIEVENAVQSTVCVALKIKKPSATELIYLEILNTILGGYFSSRLMKNIREEKGYTYGIYSFLAKYSDCLLLKIISDVGVEYTEDTVKEIFYEICNLYSKNIPSGELTRVVNYIQGELLSYADGIFNQAEYYRVLLIKGDSTKTFSQTQKTLRTIDAATLKKVAEKYLRETQNKSINKQFFTVIAGRNCDNN